MNIFGNKKALWLIVVLLALALLIIRQWMGAGRGEDAADKYSRVLDGEAGLIAAYLGEDVPVAVLAFRFEAESRVDGPLKSMIASLAKGGLKIRHIEYIERDSEHGWLNRGGFPYDEYLDVAEAERQVKAVVSLCGSPYLPTRAPVRRSGLPPLIVARCGDYTPELEELLREGLVQAAAVPVDRPGSGVTEGRAFEMVESREFNRH